MSAVDPKSPTVLGLLQCQWFKDVSRMEKLLQQYHQREGGYWPGRARFNRDMLFFGCLTGQRLEKAFGEELCGYGGIVWEEVTTKMGSKPSDCFPPDPLHMEGMLVAWKPRIIVAFGRVANKALSLPFCANYVRDNEVTVIEAPHPANRSPETVILLNGAANQLTLELERLR